MHYGVWIKTNEDSKNVLILGESHHGDDKEVGRPASYPTSQVIENYLRAKRREIKMKRSWYFFTKIAHAFSSDLGREDTISFWNSVSFGNYIDVSCEVKGPAAKNYLDDMDTSIRLNDSLFSFVNQNNIHTILCVSKLVHDKLPYVDDEEYNPLGENGRNSVKKREYKANTKYDNTNIALNHDLLLISIPHPSGYGFKPCLYNEELGHLLK